MAAQRGKASARKARLSVAQPFAIHAEPPVRTGFARQYARTVRVSGCDERAASVQPADEPAHTFRTRASGLYGNPLENRPPNGPEMLAPPLRFVTYAILQSFPFGWAILPLPRSVCAV